MIENTGLPALGVMTRLALVPVATSMALVIIDLAMARNALKPQLNCGFCPRDTALVTAFAFHVLVLVQEWKLGLIMIKRCRLPVPFVMTAIALLTQLSTMSFFLIVLFMTSHADRG